MSLFRLDPFYHSPLFRFSEPQVDASKDHQVATQAGSEAPTRQIWSPDFFNGPRIDVVEHADRFTISAELPGIKREDVHLNVDEKAQKVSITGSVKQEYHSDSAQKDDSKSTSNNAKSSPPRTIISERMYGSFSRSLKLPDSADFSAIKAKMDAGILNVDIPKYEEKKKASLRRVKIEDVPDEADK